MLKVQAFPLLTVVKNPTCHAGTLQSAETAVISHGSRNAFSYQSMFQASIFISYLDTVNSTGFLPLLSSARHLIALSSIGDVR